MESNNPLEKRLYNGRTLQEIFDEKRRLGQFQPLRGEAKSQSLREASKRTSESKNESQPDAETPER